MDLTTPKPGRCPIFPSMLKRECSHCQGTARGTRNNPRFSVREIDLDGWPGLEILKDGGPIHAWDGHFRFGRRKAEVLNACVDVLHEFWLSDGDSAGMGLPRLIEDPRRQLKVWICVDGFENFQRSDGAVVDRPYLRLQAVGPYDDRIGAGIIKSRAVWELREELRSWLRRQGVDT